MSSVRQQLARYIKIGKQVEIGKFLYYNEEY